MTAGALGQNMVGGIKLALDDYNKAHPDCTVGLKVFDSQGDPEKATPLATQIVQDSSIVGLVGPGFSGESLATGKTFDAAGLPSISPSATNVTITQSGLDHVAPRHRQRRMRRARPTRSTSRTPPTPRRSSSSTTAQDYGMGLAGLRQGRARLGHDRRGRGAAGQTDFSATVDQGDPPAPTPCSTRGTTPRPGCSQAAASGRLQGPVHVR